MIRALKAAPVKPARVVTPQCCTEVATPMHNTHWRRDRYERTGNDPNRCQRESVVEINGKHYCRLHGGALALALWLNCKLVERE